MPQYEITFQEFEYKSRVTPSPTIHQEIFKSFAAEADSQLSSMDTSRQMKLEQALIYAKRLKLKVISSSTIKRNTEYIITPLGLENSERAAKDGVTYFGVKKKKRVQQDTNTIIEGKAEEIKMAIVNDIVIPIEDKELAEKHRGQHFCVYYDLSKDCYCVKDLSLGFGTFVKVSHALVLRDNCLLHMGEHYLLVNILMDSSLPKLKVKVFSPMCTEKVYFFNAEDYCDGKISIGRAANADVRLEDSLASKIQAAVEYSAQKWMLFDGDGDKPSTNGVWLYLSEALEIVSGMVFKTNHTIMQALFA